MVKWNANTKIYAIYGEGNINILTWEKLFVNFFTKDLLLNDAL